MLLEFDKLRGESESDKEELEFNVRLLGLFSISLLLLSFSTC